MCSWTNYWAGVPQAMDSRVARQTSGLYQPALLQLVLQQSANINTGSRNKNQLGKINQRTSLFTTFPSTINFFWLSNRISCSYDAAQPICRLGNFLRSPSSPQVGANPDPLTPICHRGEVGHCKADSDKISSVEGSI